MVALSRANVRRPGDFPDTEFVTIPDVPVFAEHKTTARNGRALEFGYDELRKVAERCNRRIRESGDYATVVIGHTPDPRAVRSGQARMPEVVGYAGPFRLGMIGEHGQRQRYAILCDFHVYRQDAEKLRKYPRRSPELWLEESYDEMFLDPIALLGAEAPRLDMGLLYAAALSDGRSVEKYAFAAPSATSVSVPDFPGGKKGRYGAGANAMLSDDDVKQIVDAFEQLDWVQEVKQMLAEQHGVNTGVPGQDAGALPPEPPAPGGPPGPDAGPEDSDESGELPETRPADEEPEPMGAPGAPVPGAPPVKKMSASAGAPPPMARKYAAGVAAGSVVGATKPACDGSVDPLGSGGSPGNGKPPAGKTVNVKPYQRETQSLAEELDRLRSELHAERYARVNAQRQAQLQQLAQHFVLDLEEECSRCDYSRMTDEQFADTVQRVIPLHYQRIAAGMELYTPDFVPPVPGARKQFRDGERVAVAQYGREVSDEAMHRCDQAVNQGKYLSYEDALAQVAKERGVA